MIGKLGNQNFVQNKPKMGFKADLQSKVPTRTTVDPMGFRHEEPLIAIDKGLLITTREERASIPPKVPTRTTVDSMGFRHEEPLILKRD